MITDAQYQAWLESPNERRVMLAELEHANGHVQIADQPWLAPLSDALDDPTYLDVLVDAVGISQRIDGLAEIGDITLINDGELDEWLGYQFRGYPIRLLMGDMRWSRRDFRTVATAINAGISSASPGRMVMTVTDAGAALDEPIDTGTLPDGGGPVPLLLGQVFNVPAIRDRNDTLHYRVSYLPLSSITARDLGNTVPMSADLPGGGFTLTNHPGSGSQITAAAHEQHDTPQKILAWVADRYGYEMAPNTPLPDVTVGYYRHGDATGRQILDALARSIGAAWYIDALRRIDMRVMTAPPSEPEVVLAPDDIQDGSLKLDEIVPPWSSLALKWGRNDASLRSVAELIVRDQPAMAERLRGEWRESRSTRSLQGHPLADSQTIETLMQVSADVDAERERQLDQYSVPREYWQLTTYLPLRLHQSVMVDLPPIAGRIGRITSVAPRAGGKTDIEMVL